MDKEKATKLLVEQLVKANGQTFVTDTAYKKHLLEKAVAYYPIVSEKPFPFKFEIGFLDTKNAKVSQERLDKTITNYKEDMIKSCSKINNANYIFVENSQSYSMADNHGYTYTCLSLMEKLSFFALIGDKEVDDIKKMFYKDVNPEIVRAMNFLNIKHFINPYNSYIGDPYFLRYSRSAEGLESFFEFVFTVPYENQNLSVNQEILRQYYYRVDFVEILTREYSDGRYFKEYFSCLDNSCKGMIVDNLKNVKERNPISDSFMWANGFKELKLDHLELYKNNTKGFTDYFNNRNVEERKTIVKDIMNCEVTNEEVIKWLNENHLDLIREVGFNE